MRHFKFIFILAFVVQCRLANAAVIEAYAPRAAADGNAFLFKVQVAATPRTEDQQFNVVWTAGPVVNMASFVEAKDIYYLNQTTAGLKADDVVYFTKDGTKARIIGINVYHQFALEALDGDNKGGQFWERGIDDIAVSSGCSAGMCVGQDIALISKPSEKDAALYYTGKVSAIGTKNNVVITYGEKSFSWVIKSTQLLQTLGCRSDNSICVGQLYYDRTTKSIVKNLGFDQDGDTFLLEEIQSGPLKGKTQISSLDSEHIPLSKSCQDGLCIGEIYFVGGSTTEVRLLGFQKDAHAVLLDYSKDGSDIKDDRDSRWLTKEKKSCLSVGHFCLGDKVVFIGENTDDDVTLTIKGFERDNSLILLNETAGKYFYDNTIDKLAEIHGCSTDNKYCVGKIYHFKKDASTIKVTLTGLLSNGNFRAIQKFRDGTKQAWTVAQSSLMSDGCIKGICSEKDFNK